MTDLANTKTHGNLKTMVSRESRASDCYDYFSKIAEFEGHGDVADLFRELAESERLYVAGHLDFLRTVGAPFNDMPVGKSQLNVAAAIANELQDAEVYYSKISRTAHAEGFPDIASWFETLAHTKLEHIERFRAIQEKLGSGNSKSGRQGQEPDR